MVTLQGTTNGTMPADGTGGRLDAIVIGGGQAGLAMGYHLKQHGLRFVILDERDRVGDIWRSRWDSLRLFTPAQYDALPGKSLPLGGRTYPTRDQMADYLESYASEMGLPVRSGVRVEGLWPAGDGQPGFVVTAGDDRFVAAQVVVAAGAQQGPHVPEFCARLDPSIRQLHSSEYRNPRQLQEGGVLVVGAGNSGAEIALEAVAAHHTMLVGSDPGHVPFRLESAIAPVAIRALWFAWNHVMTVKTPIGRKVGAKIRAGHSGPLVRVKPIDLQRAGVERVYGRVTGVEEGRPVLDDGRVIDVANIVWCTGFRNDVSWVHLPIAGDDGYPLHERGVSTRVPGLYFLGLPFLYSFSSMLVGGVGRDAAFLAGRLVRSSVTSPAAA